ncbi:MAG TPA: 50S ribosomal protein L4 [Hungateiclostridium thermocellum]|uniref:Large ribosomal subunit protein uL4 n=2 Tax=Acetivibrio thermocellus TaxID=1515 RepID=RL4_ACET2|nr:50S ribosomal protein L4 [Acetivibrio thermocellus]A3DJH3.1 RecName: Full=Large ribosomal subunit protein uL4; AltName: Full=50S ribosomal protein L4 [Acetivibrio thermocellus ATCC 27405]CDG37396.1 50S ribosomal protein L4 [Acetivibrio thermocellus BC1]ABN54102.1 ribosomal protein L4/L1e [Acetivibrio thermocellus ATCC 27405]ADU73535.1 ribosomal protein L4/L1e [Acetivibrio thermocellus DSM 1313]ALX07457.1 ribosomal protein L4/L1e [Acetivibrio thermocellus AD2]ANV75196.1 ribosomal protein L4
MPKVDVYDINGKVVGEINLRDDIFGIEVNKHAIHQVIVNQLANRRQGTQSTKTKSEVRGGGRKPWRQKGTGRARHGSIRSAQWVKGGIALGPKPRSYKYAVPKKLRRLALKSALSSKVNENELLVLDSLNFDEIKTKQMANVLKNLKVNDTTAVLVLADKNRNVELSARNIPGLKTLFVNTMNVYDIIRHDKFIITKDAVAKVEEVYA